MPIEKAPFGQIPDVDLPPKLIEVDDNLLYSVNSGVNQLIDEFGIAEPINNNLPIAAIYWDGYNGASFYTRPPKENSENLYTTISMGKGNRFMHVEYDPLEKLVTKIVSHNFDENGYKNNINEWITCTMLAGLDNARSIGALSWNITKR